MVFKYVGKEPSGGSFNEMKWTEEMDGGVKLPFNPMINAGAIAIASMIPDHYNDIGRNFNSDWDDHNKADFYPMQKDMPTETKESSVSQNETQFMANKGLSNDVETHSNEVESNINEEQSDKDEKPFIKESRDRLSERFERKTEIIDRLLYIYPFIEFVRRLCGDSETKAIRVDWDLFLSERKTGHNNRSLAWQMNDNKFFDKILARHEISDSREDGVIEDILNVYFQMCSIKVTVQHLAYFAGVLANGGRDINEDGNGIQILTPREVAIATSMMSTSGLYNESGEFAYNVGIPSKSGVSGAIVGVVPGKVGLAVYSPAVDKKGNSYRGMKLLQYISQNEELSIFR